MAVAVVSILLGIQGNACASISLDEALDRARTAPGELTIRDLTTIIESGEFAGRRLTWALHQRGRRHYLNGDLDQAIEDFGAALRISPRHTLSLGDRGSALFERGDHQRARADFELLVRLQPDNPEAHYNLGLTYLEIGFPVHAVRSFTQALRLTPDFAWAYHNRGLAYMDAGQAWKAISDFDKALELNPGDPETLFARGAALDRAGAHAEAVESFSRVIAARPGHLGAYRKRAFARCSLGRVEGAVLDHITWIAPRRRFVETTERALAQLGFEPGPADGNLDARSRRAMRQWVEAGCP